MIDAGWPVEPADADPDTPDIGLQRPGSVALTLQSVIVPGGQVPLARAPLLALLAAPGPVVPGMPVGAGVGDVMPVVAEGLAMPGEAVDVELVAELGLELVLELDTPPLVLLLVPPDVPPEDIWAWATADKPSSDAATRGKSLEFVMAGSRIGNDAE